VLEAKEIARRLNVSALIEGSLRQSDERVRLLNAPLRAA
jgi:TolB-like protein